MSKIKEKYYVENDFFILTINSKFVSKLPPLKIVSSILDFTSTKKTVLTLGTFDGVHIGHKKIIERLNNSASLLDLESVVLTFFPHPRMVLQKDTSIKLLNTMDEKANLLDCLGLNNLIIHPFDQEFSRLSAQEFVETILVQQLNIKKIIIGYDHRFGRNRTADINDLIEFGLQYDFEVEQISAQEIDSVSVSSTKIRKALEEGNVTLANEYLGYSYMLTGFVTIGKGFGRTIQFPTANLKIAEDFKLIPKNGVYIVHALLDNQKVEGMMNIGMNPTVEGSEKTIEIHFFDFDADLYNKKITIHIEKRIREEKRFETIEALHEQLQKDKIESLAYFMK